MLIPVRRAAAFLALALLALTPPDGASAQTGSKLVVFAAASLATALKAIAPIFAKEKGQETVFSYGSSGVLAKQIEQGAPADVFISADTKWVDYLQKKNLLAPHSRRDLLGNDLVLIEPADGKTKLDIKPGFDLANLTGDGKIAVCTIASCPAGIY
ncbi:MAG: molybdate ABC transporter substrate-binding protein, partial [Methylovirgula sp.]|nr:molybdate ABC transporter substrate-binding protein [Methylovirgula sp.]